MLVILVLFSYGTLALEIKLTLDIKVLDTELSLYVCKVVLPTVIYPLQLILCLVLFVVYKVLSIQLQAKF